MQVPLTHEQETWLRAEVASGHFASIEQAAQQLLDERIAERSLDSDDLDWLKPLVEEGLSALERGEHVSLDEYRAAVAAHLAELKD